MCIYCNKSSNRNYAGTLLAVLIWNHLLTHQELVKGREEDRVKRVLDPDQRREVSHFHSCDDDNSSLLGYETVTTPKQ